MTKTMIFVILISLVILTITQQIPQQEYRPRPQIIIQEQMTYATTFNSVFATSDDL